MKLFYYRDSENGLAPCYEALPISKVAIYIMLLMCPFFLGLGDPVVTKNNKGNEHFAKEEYNDALAAYQDALLEDPESPELHFNIGNVLYKGERYGEAMEKYRRALSSDDITFPEKVHYNMGNAQFRQGQWGEAIASYKEALKLAPDDMDAKFNLELAQAKLKEQNQQQQQQQDLGKKGEQTKDQQQERKEGQPREPTPEEQEQQPEEQSGEPGEEKMSEEDAQRILDALKEEEKRAQKNRQVVPKMGARRVDKDW